MKKILITGASGLLGRQLIGTLTSDKLFTITRSPIESYKANQIYLDLSQDFSFDSLPKSIDIIINLAQSKHYKNFPQSAQDIFSINVASTAKLLEYGRIAGAQKFIQFSSGAVYEPTRQTLTERSKLLSETQTNFYAATKLSAEHLALSYRQYFQVQIIRPFFIFGEGQTEGMLIPNLIKTIKIGAEVKLGDSKGLRINPIYSPDAARAIRDLMNSDSLQPVVNLSGPMELSIREIAETIAEELNVVPTFANGGGKGRLVASQELLLSNISFEWDPSSTLLALRKTASESQLGEGENQKKAKTI